MQNKRLNQRGGLLRSQRAGNFASKNDLPVFKVPADAPVIPSSRAKQLDAEES
jgi:hypothetical protein